MYTNGLKDRFGSPLLSKRDADALYFDKESSETLQSNLTSHVGDTTHLTTEDRNLLDNLVAKTDINLPTLSSRWDSDFAENIGWVKSEGQWLNGNVYRDAYDLMVSKIGENDKFVEATEGTELTDENADKFLIDTAAVKFRLPLINGERVLVSSYKGDEGWYDWYSDGYLIQRGYIPTSSTYVSATVNLNKSYKNLDYLINVTTNYTNNDGAYAPRHGDKTISSFKYYYVLSTNGAATWQTNGYGSIPSQNVYNKGIYLFFKLADEVPSTVVNTEQVVADLKQECDDFKTALEEKFNSGAFVTETFQSEDRNNWYRKWSDGWIEQGGVGVTGTNVTFPTSFSNIPTLTLSEYQTGGNNSQAIGYQNITNTGFMPYRYSGGSLSINWYACGY